jgi:hypothetical protein
LALMPLKANATGSKPSTPQPTTGNASSSATAQASSAASAYGGSDYAQGGNAFGGSASSSGYGGNVSDSSNFYVLPGPVAGSNLPASICQTSQYRHFSIGWNFLSTANGDSHTDHECLNMILTVQRFRIENASKPEPKLPQMTAREHKQLQCLSKPRPVRAKKKALCT